jgi:hypothetical protein
MTSQRNCDVELDYQTLELPNNHCKTHYLPLLHSYVTPLPLTNTMILSIIISRIHSGIRTRRRRRTSFFSARGNRKRSRFLNSFHPPLKQSLYRKASIRWTQALDLSRSKHVPLTLFRPTTFRQSTTTSEQTVKSASTMEEVSLLPTNPSRTHRLNQPLTLNIFLRPLPVIHLRYYGLFYKQ